MTSARRRCASEQPPAGRLLASRRCSSRSERAAQAASPQRAIQDREPSPVLGKYTKYIAIPSFLGSILADNNEWVYDHYYDLPWERSADYFADVDRYHSEMSELLSLLYWKIISTP